ncbi:hypothetical protein HG537_0B01000 [Torulaspora globosa]|uniref:Amino acid transporter transmembrane domain-containing protein n=1 Tax=Torulaspora globosa TaxID=48254 RepID=A0A7H9HNH1_9SACH|nr:hypothetical protein HG537_0B01000 [Torulaspora sp. CBS 2947]
MSGIPTINGYSKLNDNESVPTELEFELTDFDLEPMRKDNDVESKGNGIESSVNEHSIVTKLIRENEKKSTMRWAFMNMANSILGAGVIGQPFAIKNCGIIGGLVAFIALSFLVDWTLRLIVINLTVASKKTYQDTVEYVMGRKGKYLVLLSNGLFAFGGCIGFCIIIGDTIPQVLRAFLGSSHFLLRRNVVITLVTLFISYPLSLQKNIEALSRASLLALLSMAMIVFSVIIRGPMVEATLKGSKITLEDIFITPRIFRGISVISFALVCHHNTSFIFFSMKNRSLQKFSRLTHISVCVSMIFCMILGYSGYSVFRDATKGNILNNFPENDIMINIARLCFGFNMLTTFPLEIFVLRDVIGAFFTSQDSTDNVEPDRMSTVRHFVITTICVFSTMSIALTTCNLGALFELIGATTASTMAYILPPYTNLILTKEAKTMQEKAPHYISIAFGFLIMIVSSTQTITEALRDGEQKHCNF